MNTHEKYERLKSYGKGKSFKRKAKSKVKVVRCKIVCQGKVTMKKDGIHATTCSTVMTKAKVFVHKTQTDRERGMEKVVPLYLCLRGYVIFVVNLLPVCSEYEHKNNQDYTCKDILPSDTWYIYIL